MSELQPVASTVIYRIFVAGPSDVSSDMELVKQAISDASLVAQPFGVKFEPFDWHEVPPAVGDEPQEVISTYAAGYHAFIGIFGEKAGTPTNRFPSGTIEEVHDALERLPSLQFGGPSVMVFFREQKVSIRQLDLDSAQKLQSLRLMLGEKGLFYKDYADEVELREAVFRSVGIFLSQHIKGTERAQPQPLSREADILDGSAVWERDDELGLLDYQEVIDSGFSDSAAAVGEIGETMTNLTANIEAMKQELDLSTSLSDRQRGHRAINQLAEAMELAADKFLHLTPVVSQRFEDALAASDRIVEIQEADFGARAAAEAKQRTVEAFELIRPQVVGARDAMLGNIEAQRGLARMTKELNSAKRKMLAASENMLQAYEGILGQIDEQILRLSH